jgi:hypothetical protein
VTEGLVDLAAHEDRHGPGGNPPPQSHSDDAYPCAAPSGIKFERCRITPLEQARSR